MSTDVAALVSGNLDLWTSAIERKAGVRRGGGKKVRLYGIERLRSLILDLAVRGKLVPQEAGDESTASLLKRIDKARSKRIDDGFIRGAKAEVDRANIVGPFTIPPSWVWVRLDRLGAIVGGGTPSAADPSNFAEPGNGIAWLTPADLSGFEGKFIRGGQRDLSDKGVENSSAKVLPSGSVLFTSRAPIGYVAIAANEIATNQGFKSIVPSVDGLSEFIALSLKAFAEEIDANAPGTTFKEVSGKIVSAIPFPLPPLAEQQRIVAKVDELMALCDALEAQSTSALQAHQTLVEALLATLVNATDATDLARQWARLETHFDTLFTTHASIDALKRAIVHLAVLGKLVSRNFRDEPAKEALQKASKAKEALFQREGLRARPASSIGTLMCPEGAMPSHWVTTNFDAVFVIVSGVTKGQKVAPAEAVEAPYLRVANVQRGYLDLAEIKSIAVRRADFERYQLIQGDVLMTEGGDWDKLGRAAVWSEEIAECIHQNHVFRVRAASPSILPKWVAMFVNSPMGREYFGRAAKQTTNLASINLAQLRACPLPIPPLGEQQRIVAKVDELMTLCDAQQASLADAAITRKCLADAVVERAAA